MSARPTTRILVLHLSHRLNFKLFLDMYLSFSETDAFNTTGEKYGSHRDQSEWLHLSFSFQK